MFSSDEDGHQFAGTQQKVAHAAMVQDDDEDDDDYEVVVKKDTRLAKKTGRAATPNSPHIR